MQKNRTYRLLSLQKLGAFILWLQLTCIHSGTLSDYLLHEFMPDSGVNLYHIAIHDTSGDIYVGGYNELFKLSKDFALFHNYSTCDIEGCININKVLVIDYDNDRLITCGGGNSGKCESRNLNDTKLIESSTSQVVGFDYLSAVGFIAPSSSGSDTLYIASSDDGDGDLSFRFVSRSRLNDLGIGTDDSIQLKPGYDIQYTTGFSHNSFSYFVSNRADPPSTVTTSRLSRICQRWTGMSTFSEIHLSCNGYEYVQDMFVGPVGHDFADSLGLQPEAVVLYGVFLNSPSIADSALCIFKWSDIDLAFSRALEGCLSMPVSNNKLEYVDSICLYSLSGLTATQIERFMCEITDVNYKYFQGLKTEAASSQPVLELSNHNLTAITAVVEQNHTIAFLGTDGGKLIKAHIISKETSRVYENFTVDSNSVRSDLLVSDDHRYLTILTENKVLQLRVENCTQYTTCDKCIGSTAEDGDPYCGWCTLEKKCSRQPDCASTWLPYNNAACASIQSVEPPSLLYNQGEQMLTLNIQELPPVSANSYYECNFNNGAYNSTLGASNNCTSPPVDHIPNIPEGNDHVDIELAIFSSETRMKFLTTSFAYYNCDAIKSCSECVNSSWAACRWCIGDNVCKSGQCMQNDVLVEHQNQTYCPQIIRGTKLVPVNFEKDIVIETLNLPKGKNYKCNVEIEENMMEISATLVEDFVSCDSTVYNYNKNVEELSVAMRISWDGNTIDNEYTLDLYKCAVNRPDCSRCLSEYVTEVDLECVWCEDSTCKYNGSCTEPSHVCGAPEVTEVTPTTLATSPSTLQVITVTGNDLGRDEDNILSITVNNQVCDIIKGSFNVSNQR
ncbi:plexin-A4-like [Anneissia japonica]|uniref:plexin-A4-like n=1 Tax=Anneissia japonica TaxID=1529436 RepID=UPI0014259EAD|nr:plexin-A4-like [Anneissia japonica]